MGEVLAEAGLSPLVYTMVQGAERVLWRPDRETPGVAHYVSTRKGDERLRAVEDEESLYQGDIFYYTCIGEREELLPAYEALRGDPALSVLFQEEIYRPGEFWLEIAHRDATKAHAATWLKEYLGCGEMVAFGDGLNDLPLLAAADRRCAVANAVPALREAADLVIPSNEEGGVAQFLLADTAPDLALGEGAGAFTLGLYRPGDLEELVRLFYETVHTVNPRDYTREQVDAWVPSPESVDWEAWGQSLAAHYTVVARRGGEIVGFGDMDDTGYLDRLYVHKDFQGRGDGLRHYRGPGGLRLGAGGVGSHRTRQPHGQALFREAGLPGGEGPAGGAPGRAAGKLRHGKGIGVGGTGNADTHPAAAGGAGPDDRGGPCWPAPGWRWGGPCGGRTSPACLAMG